MPWAKFNKDWDFKHDGGQAVTAYKKGDEFLVSQKAYDEAMEAGVAEALDDPTEARAKTKNKKKGE